MPRLNQGRSYGKSTGCTRTHEKNQMFVVAVTLLPHVHPPRLQALHPQGAQQQANSKFSCPQDPASHSAKYCTPIIVFHEHILYHIYCVQHPLISIRLYICFSCCMMRTSFLSPTHASSSFVPKKASRAFGSSLPWTMGAQDI